MTSFIQHRRPIRFAAAAAIGLLAMGSLAACGDDDTGTASTDTSVADGKGTTTTEEVSVLDGTYTSTTVTGYTLVAGSAITLEFSGVQLSFNAGCNNMSGNYTITDNVLKLTGDAASTMMACEDGLQAQDQWLNGLLTGGMTISEDEGSTLVLTSGDVTIEFAQGTTAQGEDLNGQEPGGTPMNGY